MKRLIDTHCHIYSEFYDDINNVITNFKKDGIDFVFNCADSCKTSKEVIKLSKEYKELYPVVGIHPEELLNIKKDEIKDNLNEIENMIKNNKVIAIGEIGLDYYYDKSNKELQKYLFEEQLKLADKYKLPVIVHVREATKDVIDILKKYSLKGIIHCFNGSIETARIYIKMGYLLGVGGLLTFKNCNLKNIINDIGLQNIVLETDSPFLTPEPYRGCKNEPKFIIYTFKKLSELTKLSEDELATITCQNIRRVFDI